MALPHSWRFGYCRAMITHQEIAAGADEDFQAALLMSLNRQDGGRAI